MVEKVYECTVHGCDMKYVAAEARSRKWLCGCGKGKIVASWWGTTEEKKKIAREQSLGVNCHDPGQTARTVV